MVASTSTLPETLAPPQVPIATMRLPAIHPQFQEGSVEAVIPASQFYGVPALALPLGGYIEEGEDRHVKSPLEEGTPLHI
jgi:hypothetical protein